MTPTLIPAEIDDGATTAVNLRSRAAEMSPVLYVRSTVGLAEPTELFAAYMRFDKNRRWLLPVFQPPYVFTLRPVDSVEDFIKTVVSSSEDFTAVLQAMAKPALTPEQVRDHAVMQVQQPEVSRFSCSLCSEYRVDLVHFTVGLDHSGQPYKLPPGSVPHCLAPGGSCAKGNPEVSLGVSNPRFRKLWQHYWTYRFQIHKLSNCQRYMTYRSVLDNVVQRGNNPGTDPLAGRGASRGAGFTEPDGSSSRGGVSPPDVACIFCGNTACQSGECRRT